MEGFAQQTQMNQHNNLSSQSVMSYLEEKNYSKCVEVCQQGFGITKSTHEKPFISTFGMGSCIGIVGYSSKYKIAFILHLDNPKMIHDKNMGSIYYKIKQAIKNNHDGIQFDVQLFGGFQMYRQEFVDYIYSQFNRYNYFHKNANCSVKINIIKNNIGTDLNSSSICIDTNNGNLYKFDGRNTQFSQDELKINEMRIIINAHSSEPDLIINHIC